MHPRVALFRLFSKIWNSVRCQRQIRHPDCRLATGRSPPRAHYGNAAPSLSAVIRRRLFRGGCRPHPRRWDRTTLQTGWLSNPAKSLRAQIATDVLIIEDEVLIAMDLESTRPEPRPSRDRRCPHPSNEAIAVAQKTGRPGLILADIQLADGSSGLEAVNDLLDDHSRSRSSSSRLIRNASLRASDRNRHSWSRSPTSRLRYNRHWFQARRCFLSATRTSASGKPPRSLFRRQRPRERGRPDQVRPVTPFEPWLKRSMSVNQVVKIIRAQPIGPSVAPKSTSQARGEGERMAGPHDKSRSSCWFRSPTARVLAITQV